MFCSTQGSRICIKVWREHDSEESIDVLTGGKFKDVDTLKLVRLLPPPKVPSNKIVPTCGLSVSLS